MPRPYITKEGNRGMKLWKSMRLIGLLLFIVVVLYNGIMFYVHLVTTTGY